MTKVKALYLVKTLGLFLIVLAADGFSIPQMKSPIKQKDNSIQVRWTSERGKVYQVESTDNLNPGQDGKVRWTVRDERVIAPGNEAHWLDTGNYETLYRTFHPTYVDQRFYRVAEVGSIANTNVGIQFVGLNSGAILTGDIEITVQANVSSGIFDRIRLFIDGEEQDSITSNPAIFSINTTEFSNGTHEIEALVEVIDGVSTTPSDQTSNEGLNSVGFAQPVQVNFENLIHEYDIAIPYFDAYDPNDVQVFAAKFTEPVNWTLQILDADNNFIAGFQDSGSKFRFIWDGYSAVLGSFVYPGYYNYVLTATTTGVSGANTPFFNSALKSSSAVTQKISAVSSSRSSNRLSTALFPNPEDTLATLASQKVIAKIKSLSDLNSGIRTLQGSPKKIALSSRELQDGGKNQTSQNPRRKQPRGQVGTTFVAGAGAQGNHPAKGTGLPWYGPINRATTITDLFLREMGRGSTKIPAVKTSFHLKDDQLTLESLIGTQGFPNPTVVDAGQSTFNTRANIALLVGHTVEANHNTFQRQAFYPLYKTGATNYKNVPYVQMQFGAPYQNRAPLLWMGAFSCNNITTSRFSEVWDKGLTPAYPYLNLFLGTGSFVYMYPSFGDLWARGMNGKLTGTVMTIANAWHEAGRLAHAAWGGSNPGNIHSPVIMNVMYWNATQEGGDNTLLDKLNSYSQDRWTGRSAENLHLDTRTVYTP